MSHTAHGVFTCQYMRQWAMKITIRFKPKWAKREIEWLGMLIFRKFRIRDEESKEKQNSIL